MPHWGSVTLLEGVWTLLFLTASWKVLRVLGPIVAVRALPPVPGVDEEAQRVLADFFVLLARLLLVMCACGVLIGAYAALLPSDPGGGPPLLRSAGGVLVPVLLCVLGGAVVWTAWAMSAAFRKIGAGGGLPTEDEEPKP